MRASANREPPSIFSLISRTIPLRLTSSICAPNISSDCTRGSPDVIIVESCRVKITIWSIGTFALGLYFSFFSSFFSANLVTITPSFLRVERSASSDEAFVDPFLVVPEIVLPSHSYSGISQ